MKARKIKYTNSNSNKTLSYSGIMPAEWNSVHKRLNFVSTISKNRSLEMTILRQLFFKLMI